MTDEGMKSRIKTLEHDISVANDYYWNKPDQGPLVDDFTYDRMVEELKRLDPDNPLVAKVADSDQQGIKVKHVKPMLSLDKVYSWDDLVKWCEGVARSKDELFCFSPKYDGNSVEIANGRLVTRGKGGDYGNDITHLAPWIHIRMSFKGSSLMLSSVINSEHWRVNRYVGELVVPYPQFEKLKNSYPEFAEYKTPRNLASGFANTSPSSPLLNTLMFAGRPVPVATWVYHRAKELTLPLTAIKDAEKEIVGKLRNFQKIPCDGIVCRLMDDKYGESLGVTQHHPRNAMALKFKDDEYQTTVKKIVWQVGNEAITPVAEFDPVDIDGVNVSRATCHNAKFVADNNLVPGSRISIVRRGGVIPKIVKVEKDNSPIIKCRLPTKCPVCGQDAVYEEPDMICVNQTCPGRCTSKIIKGLDELGIKGIGPSMVERLVRELHIATIIDFCMEAWDRDILLAKGFTAHEIHVLMSEIERAVNVGQEDVAIFASLCIPMASRSFAEKVIKYRGDIMYLLESDPDKLYEDLSKIPGINTTAARNVVDFIIEGGAELFESYYNLFVHKKPSDIGSRKKYCFTGALPKPRKELEQFVMDAGGYPTDNIRQTDYLVSASPTSTSTKMLYARKHNIPIITFEELNDQLSK